MDANALKDRTKAFALEVLRLVDDLPRTTTGWAIGKQLVRSGTSIGANYRSACKARSKAEFVSKITIAEEEADETQYWLELLRDGKLADSSRISTILAESRELTAILTASGKTARAGLRVR